MAEFGADILDDVLAACQAGAEDAAGALQRAFDGEFSFAATQASELSADAVPETLAQPGLALALQIGDSSAAILIPQSLGLPDWIRSPDQSDQSKLDTLAQELGIVLLPEQFMPMSFQAAHVDDLGEALKRSRLAGTAACIPAAVEKGDTKSTLHLVWPLPDAMKMFDDSPAVDPGPAPAAPEPPAAATEPSPASPQPPTDPQVSAAPPTFGSPQSAPPQPSPTPRHKRPKRVIRYEEFDDGIRQLPEYARSLLRVKVPVRVTLASARQPIESIVELRPGAILQFSKSCDELLTMEVGDQQIAEGEAVKVGEKFGLKIASIKMPRERFWRVKPNDVD